MQVKLDGLLVAGLVVLLTGPISTVSRADEPNPFVREGSIGKTASVGEHCPKDGFSYRPITCWKDEKFLFLPQSKRLREFGYQSIRLEGSPFYSPGLAHDKYAGRVATVTDVQRKKIGWSVSMLTDQGERVIADASGDNEDDANVNKLAPLLDLQAAHDRWLGKSLWMKRDKITVYNDESGKFDEIAVKRCSAVKVTDVIAGDDNFQPVRLVLSTSSGEGFVPVQVSGTNAAKILRGGSFGFEESFFETDPRLLYPGSDEVWKAIEGSRVFMGMSAKHAELAWGKPQKVNSTILEGHASEQWIYGDRQYLYITNGKVSAVQQEHK